jgi:hypothetical protein
MKKFYEPYTVKMKKWFPVLLFEDTPIITFGFMGWFQAKETAKLMNMGYMCGVSAACAQTEDGNKIFKSFYN